MKKRTIIMIAAFPPPVAGQSLAAEILAEGIESETENAFYLIKLNLAEALSGEHLLKRIAKLLSISGKLLFYCIRDRDLIVYLQLGHGKASILRDTAFLSIAQLFRKDTVVHVHGSGYADAMSKMPSSIQYLAKYLVSKSKAAIVLSESLRRLFDGIVDPNRIFVVENGLESAFEIAAKNSRKEKKETKNTRVLFLSNLLADKGFESLLKAALLAKEKTEALEFVFAGPKFKDQGVDIEDFIIENNLENVRWIGSVGGREKIRAYTNADIFCLPSRYEGQPLCILEAMHFSLPVVSTNVGGIPDIFNHCDGAILIEPDDHETLFYALQELAHNEGKREKMGEQNRERARKIYTSQEHIRKMLQIFKNLV